MAKMKTASVLAFERKLSNSDAHMYSGNWSDRNKAVNWQPIKLKEKAVRGTISNRQKAAISNDPTKMDQEIQKPNLQRVDVAALPMDADTLKVAFSLRVLGQLEIPSACDNPEYQAELQKVIRGYAEAQGFEELAVRYATNIANGRFLWRNRVGAEAIMVRVTPDLADAAPWEFDAHEFDLRAFDHDSGALKALAGLMQQGLCGEQFVLLKIEAYARLGEGQEVFPSQELVLDSSNSKSGKKSKVLYHVQDVAAMHSQKIGNALRTIDDWYGEAEEYGPISVEPFGSVTSRGKAFRPNKNDFYTLFDKWITAGQIPELDDQHYVMATLIRGGVFGEKSE